MGTEVAGYTLKTWLTWDLHGEEGGGKDKQAELHSFKSPIRNRGEEYFAVERVWKKKKGMSSRYNSRKHLQPLLDCGG